MGWLVALAVLVALAILPIGVSARFDSNGPLVLLLAGPVRIRVFPASSKNKEKEKKSPKKEKKKKTTAKTETAKKPEKKKTKGGKWTDFLPLVRVALDLLDSFRRKLRVKRLNLKLIMAGGDPCDLAVNYGKAWIALGNLMPLLERAFVIKKRDLEVECDFTSEETLVVARLDLTITIGRLLSMVVWHGVRALYHLIKIINKRKGGAKNEQKSS